MLWPVSDRATWWRPAVGAFGGGPETRAEQVEWSFYITCLVAFPLLFFPAWRILERVQRRILLRLPAAKRGITLTN